MGLPGDDLGMTVDVTVASDAAPAAARDDGARWAGDGAAQARAAERPLPETRAS